MRVLNTESGPRRTCMPFVVMLFAVVSPAWAQDEQISNQGQLRKAIIERRLGQSGIFNFISLGISLSSQGPAFGPIIGLHDPTAVPYLLDVLQNGPDWSDDELPRGGADKYRYVARCYAALCLGIIGDSRAFDPLLATLNNTDIGTYPHHPHRPQGRQYNLRAHAAFALGDLGDRRAVNPLIKSLRRDGYAECIYALTRLHALSAVPVIVQVASDRKMFSRYLAINRCLDIMLKVRFTFRQTEERKSYYIIDQFPEIGPVPREARYRTLWQHWIKAGDKYARTHFEENYAQLKVALKDKPNARSLHAVLRERMVKGGVAALPYMMREIEEGDASLVRAAARLAWPRSRRIKDPDPKLSENATRAEALEWWQGNKQKWTVFQILPDSS